MVKPRILLLDATGETASSILGGMLAAHCCVGFPFTWIRVASFKRNQKLEAQVHASPERDEKHKRIMERAIDIESPIEDIAAALLGIDILELSPRLQISPREIAKSASVEFGDGGASTPNTILRVLHYSC